MLLRKLFHFLMILQFPITVFASNLKSIIELDTRPRSQVSSLTPVQIAYNELIEKLDELGNPSLKTLGKIALAKQIQTQFIEKAPILSTEQSALQKIFSHSQYKLITEYVNANLNNLKLISEEYFTNYYIKNGFTVQKVNFLNKTNGDQTGSRMIIFLKRNDDNEESNVTYYIKTHQTGSRNNQASASIIDPKEIFIYKLLELMKIGPKAHFFSSNLSRTGVYIATRDAGFTKKTNKINNSSFKTFEDFAQDYIENVLGIDSIPGTKNIYTELCLKHINIINEDKILLKSISTADLLARIFRLTDLTTNSSNYGFKIKGKELKELKIVDFRTCTDASYSPPGLYEGFIQGNGSFNYTINNLLLYILKQRNLENRKTMAKEILEELVSQKNSKLGIKQAIEKALEFTKHFCQDGSIGVKPEAIENDLVKYATQTLDNFNDFKNKLSQN